MNTEVTGEADRTELMREIYDNTPGNITAEIIKDVLLAYEIALASLLKKSQRLPDGSLRAELYGGDIIHLKRTEAHDLNAFGQVVKIPTHFAVYVKKHAVSLQILEAALGLPCVNG